MQAEALWASLLPVLMKLNQQHLRDGDFGTGGQEASGDDDDGTYVNVIEEETEYPILVVAELLHTNFDATSGGAVVGSSDGIASPYPTSGYEFLHSVLDLFFDVFLPCFGLSAGGGAAPGASNMTALLLGSTTASPGTAKIYSEKL
ncbi:unnamed protein product, partial [Amoebophrya sp. A120]